MAEVAESLEDRLSATLHGARKKYGAFRAEVAHYLFDHGLKKTIDALPWSPGRDRLLDQLWALQMESIGTRMFGVSTDAWRDNAAYPDRYFPLVWLDLVPTLLPKLDESARLPAVVALFNLGEHLVIAAPSVGGLVAEALIADVDGVVRDGVEAVALGAMVDLGLLPPEATKARPRTAAQFRAVAAPRSVLLSTFEPRFVPGAIAFEGDGRTVKVSDRTQSISLAIGIVGTAPQLVARTADRLDVPRDPLPVTAQVRGGFVAVDDHGQVTFTLQGKKTTLGAIDPRSVCAVAVSAAGLVAVTRRFSQRLELHALKA